MFVKEEGNPVIYRSGRKENGAKVGKGKMDIGKRIYDNCYSLNLAMEIEEERETEDQEERERSLLDRCMISER